jgi:hypothetical protein
MLGAFVVLTASTAAAHPRPLPFTYGSETLAPGEVEVEQFADAMPLRALSATSGARASYTAFQLLTELEVGVRERLELGLYFTMVPSPPDSLTATTRLTEGNGAKQRLRYAFASPGAWPVDVGLYLEVVENDREVELEGKILLQRRIGDLRLDANLWAEYELYYQPQRDVVLNPTLGATYEVTRMVHVGVDSFMRVEFPEPAVHPRPFEQGPHVYAGPAVLLQLGKLWWTTGVFARVTDTSHSMQPGEAFGPLWLRVVLGYEL